MKTRDVSFQFMYNCREERRSIPMLEGETWHQAWERYKKQRGLGVGELLKVIVCTEEVVYGEEE